MLTPALEAWHSGIVGDDPFYVQIREELTTLSIFIDQVSESESLANIKDLLTRVLDRRKPTGSAPDPNSCPRCGKTFP
jgi:hypothetical protein